MHSYLNTQLTSIGWLFEAVFDSTSTLIVTFPSTLLDCSSSFLNDAYVFIIMHYFLYNNKNVYFNTMKIVCKFY